MGWGSGMAGGFNPRTGLIETRPAGYNIGALCDVRGCQTPIDRGLAWRCGEMDSLDWGGEEDGKGCGAYVCGQHYSDHGCPNPFRWEDEDDDLPDVCTHGLGWDVECQDCDVEAEADWGAALLTLVDDTEWWRRPVVAIASWWRRWSP